MFGFSDRICLAEGSLNQGDLDGGGRQCTCIALAFLCLHSSNSLQDKMAISSTVDSVIREGTNLYSKEIARRQLSDGQKPPAYLLISELPESLSLRGLIYAVTKMEPVYTGLLGTVTTDISSLTYCISDAAEQCFRCAKSCFLTLGPPSSAFTSAICQTDKSFLCFDSHSRDEFGLSSQTGKGVIIETSALSSLVQYIKDLSSSLFHSASAETPFEFVPVTVHCEAQMATDGVQNLRQSVEETDTVTAEVILKLLPILLILRLTLTLVVVFRDKS
jgi:hypothetical protein